MFDTVRTLYLFSSLVFDGLPRDQLISGKGPGRPFWSYVLLWQPAAVSWEGLPSYAGAPVRQA